MEKAIAINDNEAYLAVQTCDSGYDYTFFNRDFILIDGGQYDDPEQSIGSVILQLMQDLSEYGLKVRYFCLYPYEKLMYMTERIEMRHLGESQHNIRE